MPSSSVDLGNRSASRRSWPVLLHVIGGFVTGTVIGYVVAFVIPRRAGLSTYQAPTPPGHQPSSPVVDLLAQRVTQDAP